MGEAPHIGRSGPTAGDGSGGHFIGHSGYVRGDALPVEWRAIHQRKGSIIIYPGEHFAIAFKIENGKIVGAVPEPAGSQRANAVEVSFEQMRPA